MDNWSNRLQPLTEHDHGGVDWLFRDGLVVAEPPVWSAASLPAVDVAWLRPVAPVPTGDAWSGRERPMLHVTLVTVFNGLARPLLKVLAARAAPVAASDVVTVGPGLDPGGSPGFAHAEFHGFIPLGELLSGCDGVLAHAGWGTVTACAAAGVSMAGARPDSVRVNSTASSLIRSPAVPAGPSGGDVGDDPPVVRGVEHRRHTDGATRIDPVHPQVAQVDRVDEVTEPPRLHDRPVDGSTRFPPPA